MELASSIIHKAASSGAGGGDRDHCQCGGGVRLVVKASACQPELMGYALQWSARRPSGHLRRLGAAGHAPPPNSVAYKPGASPLTLIEDRMVAL